MSYNVKDVMSEELQGAYINLVAETGLEHITRRQLGVTARMLEATILHNPDFAEQLSDARLTAADMLEKEARRRAVEGYEEDVFYKGEYAGTKTVYSDSLLALLLKGRKRDVFGDSTKLLGDAKEPLTITIRDMTAEAAQAAVETAIINVATSGNNDDLI